MSNAPASRPSSVFDRSGPSRVGFELAPHGRHVDLDKVGVIGVVAPHLGEQHELRQRAAPLLGQIEQQPELGGGEVEGLPGPGGERRLLVDHEIADAGHPVGQAAAPAEDGRRPGQKLFQDNGFDDVVVGAEGEAGQPVGHRLPGGDEHDRYVVALPQGTGQGHAVAAGQHDVEDGQVGPEGDDPLDVGAVSPGPHGVPGPLERAGDSAPLGLAVFDDGDARRRFRHGRSCCHQSPRGGRRLQSLQRGYWVQSS